MTVEYKPQEGYAIMTFNSTDAQRFTDTFTKIYVGKQYPGSNAWERVQLFDVDDPSNFSFTFVDYYVIPMKTYRYIFVPFKTDTQQSQSPGLSFPSNDYITPLQEGVMITDGETYYYSDLDVEIKASRQYAVSYVQPYYARTPHAIHNGNLDYYKGSCSALWLPKDDSGNYIKEGCSEWKRIRTEGNWEWIKTREGSNEYKQGFMNWLTDGNPKVLKTRQGQAWLVSIDEEISNYDDDFIDDGHISFNWTEIGDMPTTGGIVMLS